MQFKFAALCTLAVATLAAATPQSQCDVGTLQCCQSVQTAGSKQASTLLGLLKVVVEDVTAMVGITCSSITVIGVSGNSCNAQPVCCTNNSFNGIIAIGCTPININL